MMTTLAAVNPSKRPLERAEGEGACAGAKNQKRECQGHVKGIHALTCSSAEEFMKQLPDFDKDMSKERNDAEAVGEVLRYVGVVDVVNEKGAVELKRYKKEHPFAQLSGSDNIIAFTTARYNKQPLIVRGPGAGAEVTAGGIFSDILRLASYLGAPS